MNKTADHLIILSETDSSNNYAIRLIKDNNAIHGTTILALCQSSGKGQQRKQWDSEPNMNMLASIITNPRFLPAEKQFYLSMITSLAIYDFLNNEIAEVSVKWPNDIYCGNKKICGILIENIVQGDYLFASVAGLGLNLNQTKFSSELANPISLKMITGKNYLIEEVLISVRKIFFKLYDILEAGLYNYIEDRYLSVLYKKGEWCRFKEKERTFEAMIIGIGLYGRLVVKNRSGNISEYMFGEIELVKS